LFWDGHEYTLPEGDGRGNAIHGFVHGRPWRVLEQTDSAIVGQFQASVDDPALLEHWPADFRITATYTLETNRLVCDYRLENPDQRPLPCGFGTHPYFRVPLTAKGQADDCRVQLPVSSIWELVDMSATGRVQPLENAPAYRQGLPFGQMHLDNVFGGLDFEGQWCWATIEDPRGGRSVTLSFDKTFEKCVVYNPPHRQAVCIEPYSCVPDCFRLAGMRTEEDPGLRVLAAGESITARMAISAR
jgi:aldose 1-epimerase